MGGEGFGFNGLMDEIAIFDEALTQSEIQDIMNNGIGVGSEFTAVKALSWGRIKDGSR